MSFFGAAITSLRFLFTLSKLPTLHSEREPIPLSDKTTYITVVTNKSDDTVAKCVPTPANTTTHRRQYSPSLPERRHKRQRHASYLSYLFLKSRRLSLPVSTQASAFTDTLNGRHLTSCPLQGLPSELIHCIAQYLDHRSVLSLSQTSKHFYMLCCPSHNSLWRQLFVNHFEKMASKMPHPPPHTTYYQLYRKHYILNQRWQRGEAKIRYLTGHTDSVYCIARFGCYLLSGSRDHSIKLWNLNDIHTLNPCITTRTAHSGSVLCIQVSSQHQWMVSGSSDSTCVLWRLPSLKVISRLRGHSHGVLDVCIVQDKWVVSASRDSTVRIWDHVTGKELGRLVGHHGPVNALQSHENLVVSAAGDATLKLWDVESRQCLRTFTGHTRGLTCVQFDGRHIYSGGQDAMLKIWDVLTGECVASLTGHKELIRAIDCCGDKVLTGSYDRTLRVWNSTTGQCVLSFQKCHESWVFNTLLSPTGLISAGQDRRIMVLDFAYGLDLSNDVMPQLP